MNQGYARVEKKVQQILYVDIKAKYPSYCDQRAHKQGERSLTSVLN